MKIKENTSNKTSDSSKIMIDQQDISEQLLDLGLKPSCDIMVHASLSSLGLVKGGANSVIKALSTASGSAGAVIAPSFRDSIRSNYYALQHCIDCCPQELCPSPERGYTGIIGETVRQLPGSLRSCHPTHSWVGVGQDAQYLLSGHYNSLTPCGNDSPFFRLMQKNGWILLLGVSINTLTNMHAVEDARNVPYLSAYDSIHRHATYTTSGKRIQYAYPELLLVLFKEIGILKSKKIGAGFAHILSARDLGSFLWIVTERNPWCLVLRPNADKYEPFKDACSKVEEMFVSWNNNPDRNAWNYLLEESKKKASPVNFSPADKPSKKCPAYRGMLRGYHRCAANDLPAWEKSDDYPNEPGVATCEQCNWPELFNI